MRPRHADPQARLRHLHHAETGAAPVAPDQLFEELRERGFTAGSRWLQRDIGIASPVELLSLGLSPNMPVARLKRLRTADDVVMAIETTTIPAQYMPNPHSVTDSLYGYLEANGTIPMRALQHIRRRHASAEQARLANIPAGCRDAAHHPRQLSRQRRSGGTDPLVLPHDYYEFVAESRR